MTTPTVPAGYVPVTLPSRGLLYGDLLPDGVVHIRKLKVAEEALIQSSSSGLALINGTVGTCTRLPAGMSHLDLLMTDRLALLVALRVYTFGVSYGYSYKCQVCGAKNVSEYDLGKLTSKRAADGLVEPIFVTLPDNGATVGLRFLRGKDEQALANASKRVAMQSNDPTDVHTHMLRKVLQIVTINGVEVDSVAKEAFVRELTMVDSQAMADAIDAVESGVDLTLHPECQTCGSQAEMGLPFTLDFFRAPRRTA